MIDIVSFNKALKAAWIKKYLDESNKGKWKLFLDAELENFEGPVVLNNLKQNRHEKYLQISCSFF